MDFYIISMYCANLSKTSPIYQLMQRISALIKNRSTEAWSSHAFQIIALGETWELQATTEYEQEETLVEALGTEEPINLKWDLILMVLIPQWSSTSLNTAKVELEI